MRERAGLVFERRLDAAWNRSDVIFDLIPAHRLLDRPIGLRHPILFYLGHLPAFAWNQVGRGVLGERNVDEHFDVLFERGIDPADEGGAHAQSISNWPAVDEVVAYRDRVRKAVRERIDVVLARSDDVLCEHGRILHVAIEHELMHHETLMYMLAECPGGLIVRPEDVLPPEDGEGRVSELRHVSAGMARIGTAWEDVDFGWDNEFGKVDVSVPAFQIDSLPVRNRDWLEFVTENDLDDAWLPKSWIRRERDLHVKTVLGPVPYEIAAGWPVQVCGERAGAYCVWRGGRLPTEAELYRAAEGTLGKPAGPIGFSRWYASPVGRFPSSASRFGVEELVGNGWEWTSTPFAPLPGFRPYVRTYPGYSADFFDDAHNVVFGASWATDGVFLRPSFRNWYRRNYPYAFTKFRCVMA